MDLRLIWYNVKINNKNKNKENKERDIKKKRFKKKKDVDLTLDFENSMSACMVRKFKNNGFNKKELFHFF